MRKTVIALLMLASTPASATGPGWEVILNPLEVASDNGDKWAAYLLGRALLCGKYDGRKIQLHPEMGVLLVRAAAAAGIKEAAEFEKMQWEHNVRCRHDLYDRSYADTIRLK